MSGLADRPVQGGPYETEQQARADVTEVYEQARHSLYAGECWPKQIMHV